MPQLDHVTRFDQQRSAPGVFWRVTCCRCSAEGLVRRKGMKNTREGAEERFIATRLRQAGWDIDFNLKSPECPGCIAAIAKRRSEAKAGGRILSIVSNKEGNIPMPAQDLKVVSSSDVTTADQLHADPPRAPTPRDNRRIRDALDEAYEEDRGYKKGFSDETIGRALVLPWAWVKAMREMLYGPAIPAAVAALLPDIARLDQRIKASEIAIQRAQSDLATQRDDLSALKARISQIES